MSKGLDKIHVIDRARLSEEHYFYSLLGEAHDKGLLGDGDIERLQHECLHLLAHQTEKFNAGISGSVRVEKAQDIMTSILFTIGVWIKTYHNPDDAVTALREEPINLLYQKGRGRIDTLLAIAKVMHAKLLHQLVDTPNVYYRSTLESGILGFFKLYNPEYSAHEIHITADYPLLIPIPKLAGIEFIKAYLEAAYTENRLCSYFSSVDIHHLLCGYEEDYQELALNIYEPVLTAAIGCVISNLNWSLLRMNRAGMQYLCKLFEGQSRNEIMTVISKATDALNANLHFSPGLVRYIQNSLPLIAVRIEIASRTHTLDRVFLSPAFPETNPKILFSFGDKMDDRQYRRVIEEIGECRFSPDKVAIIKEHIRSLSDLEDVLLDADLLQEEIQAVLQELGLPEIAALSKRYQLYSDIGANELREREQLLRQILLDFLAALPQEQQVLIAQASQAIQEE